MTTWVDTNVLVAIWSGDEDATADLQAQMEEAGKLVVSGCVWSEFLGGPRRSAGQVFEFLQDLGIVIAWQTGEDVWLLAGERYAAYAERRRRGHDEPKRFIADFLIGAQATVRGGRLMTFDHRIYAAAFPELTLVGRSAGIPPL